VAAHVAAPGAKVILDARVDRLDRRALAVTHEQRGQGDEKFSLVGEFWGNLDGLK
jgi:hypothetical protein